MEFFIIALGLLLIGMGCFKAYGKKEIQMGIAHAGAGVAVIMLSIFSLPDTEDIEIEIGNEAAAETEIPNGQSQNENISIDIEEDEWHAFEYTIFLNEQIHTLSELTNELEKLLLENNPETQTTGLAEELNRLVADFRDYFPLPSVKNDAYTQHQKAIEGLENLMGAQTETISPQQVQEMLLTLTNAENQLQQALLSLEEE